MSDLVGNQIVGFLMTWLICHYKAADQHLRFPYKDSTIPLLTLSQFYKPLAIFFGCTAWFVSDLVVNPEDRFSHDEVQAESGFIQMNRIVKFILSMKNIHEQMKLYLLESPCTFLLFFVELWPSVYVHVYLITEN